MSKIKHDATHEIVSFTFSSGEVMARCKMPECSWGEGHYDQSIPSASKLYSSRSKKVDVDEEVELEPEDEQQEDDVPEIEELTVESIFSNLQAALQGEDAPPSYLHC